MAFRLTKVQVRELQSLQATMKERRAAVEAVAAEFDLVLASALCRFNDAIGVYNASAADAQRFVDEVAGNWRDEYDEKSDRWKDGDAGYAASDLVDGWENAVLDSLEPAQLPSIVLAEDILTGELWSDEVLARLPKEAQ